MVEYAFAHPVLRDKIEDYRKLATEMEGERHDDHRQYLLEQGIHRERVFLQRMPQGPALALLHWDCDSPARAMRWEDEPSPHGQFIRDRIIRDVAGVPDQAMTGSMPVNEQVLDVQGLPGVGLTSYVFALPIREGREEDAIESARAVSAGGTAHEDFVDFLRECGITRERVWIQPAMPGTPGPSLAIVVRDCDDPQATIQVSLRSSSAYARRLQDEILPEIHGVDFSDRLPRPNELVALTHVRRSDAEQDPVKALLLRGYEAFGTGDFDTLSQLMAADVRWTQVGDNPMSGTYVGRDAVFAHFQRLFEETAGTLTVDVDEILVGQDTGMVVQRNRAERKGRTLDTMAGVHFTIRDGQVVEARAVPMEDPSADDAFWR